MLVWGLPPAATVPYNITLTKTNSKPSPVITAHCHAAVETNMTPRYHSPIRPESTRGESGHSSRDKNARLSVVGGGGGAAMCGTPDLSCDYCREGAGGRSPKIIFGRKCEMG